MAKKRTRTRVSSKIDELPEALRVKVDVMLADTSNTYEYISQYLKQEGYEISKSSVGRYAMRSNTATQRLLEAQVQTEQLIRVVKDNPDADYTEAAIMLTMNGLVNKVATAEEEFQEMPLDKAGRLIASLSRTKVYKDRVRQDMKKKADIAFKEMETEMMKVIKNDPQSAEQLKDILTRVDCQHFFRQIFLGYFSDIVQAFDTLRKNVCGDDYTSLHNPTVLSSVLPAYGMFHSIQILFL